MSVICNVCFRHCTLQDGEYGFCHARRAENDTVVGSTYGKVTALALDPIEKKPLNRFYPGSKILSVGLYGCNLRCPFCQNHEIAMADRTAERKLGIRQCSPEDLLHLAQSCVPDGNIGLAFTYNEPMISVEYVRDTEQLIKDAGMKTALVTNGCATEQALQEVLPLTDAMNIDLKCFREDLYASVLGGNLPMVKDFIARSHEQCHVELTTLLVPGLNDTEEDLMNEVEWIAGLPNGADIPLHLTRFFPRFHYADRKTTPVSTVYALAEKARTCLNYVYVGNC
ncbi:MAG: AmmeMemoRadiSam system radical SAM enzyme [Clostridia bacterium]|nr:AmmeMemoRadiSam system radical SAM enzyme [Clostridia bacterium]